MQAKPTTALTCLLLIQPLIAQFRLKLVLAAWTHSIVIYSFVRSFVQRVNYSMPLRSFI